MHSRRPEKRLLRVFRSGVVATAAIAFLVAAVGVPLPSGVRKDRSVPFPCMDRSCGCHDAAGCKEHCCCFTNDEKLAWAAEHHVDPKPFAECSPLARQAERSSFAAGYSVEGSANELQSLSACGASGLRGCCSDKASTPRAADDGGTKWISIAAYRHCTGQAPLWTLLGAALRPAPPVCYEFDWVPAGYVALSDCDPLIVAVAPSPPPPRLSLRTVAATLS